MRGKRFHLSVLVSVVFVLFALLPTLIIYKIGSSSSRAYANESAEEAASALNIAEKNRIDGFFRRYINIIAHVALSESSSGIIGGYYDAGKDDFQILASAISEADDGIEGVYLANKDGMILAGYPSSDILGASVFSSDVSNAGSSDTVISSLTSGEEAYFSAVRPISFEGEIIGYAAVEFSGVPVTLSGTNTSHYLRDSSGNMLNVNGSPVAEAGEIEKFSGIVRSDVISGNSGGYTFSASQVAGTNFKIYTFVPQEYTENSADEAMKIPIAVLAVSFAVSAGFLIFFAVQITGSFSKTARYFEEANNERDFDDLSEELSDSAKGSMLRFSDPEELFLNAKGLLKENIYANRIYSVVSDISGDMAFDWSIKDGTLFLADKLKEFFCFDSDADNSGKITLCGGTFIDAFMSDEQAKQYRIDMTDLINRGTSLSKEYLVRIKEDEDEIWISVKASAVTDRYDVKIRIVGIINNIDREKKSAIALENKANKDFLSGLYNRATFLRMLSEELERDKISPIAVIFVDIDDFKFINDRYNHSAGDEIIKHVAVVLNEKIEKRGFSGRFGGDEFVGCVTDPEVVADIGQLADELLAVYAKGYRLKEFGVTIKIKASIGIAVSPQWGRETDVIVSRADEAMYFVKKHGKSNCHIYDGTEFEDGSEVPKREG